MLKSSESVRVAAVGDLHFSRGSPSLRPLLDRVVEEADMLALCGDLTDTGLPEEAILLAKEFATVKMPFAGVKGFAGGFGRGTLGPWGEDGIKRFVHEALDEALKLESALKRLRTPNRIALLHYAPIVGTVEGEPPEIYPWLGSSRLEEPL